MFNSNVKTHAAFTTQLDGEFAIALIQKTCLLFQQTIATKPLWISSDIVLVLRVINPFDRLGLKSIEKIPANHTNVYKISKRKGFKI